MTEIWESAAFRDKLQRLPPDLRDRFVRFVKTMYDKESDMMVRFIGESRNEMRNTAQNIYDEQESLRDEADRISQASRMSSARSRDVYSPSDSIFAEAVDSYITREEGHLQREDSVGSLTLESVSQKGSPVSTPPKSPEQERAPPKQPPPVPPITKREATISPEQEAAQEARLQEESLEILKNVSGYDCKVENERDRQAERVEKLKRRVKAKKQQREDLAHELLDMAKDIEANRQKDKERSEKKLKERLEERKKRHQGDAPDNPVIVDMEKHE